MMAHQHEGRGEIELYNYWFQCADLDKDGVLSGGEAVQFFQRSGLPRNPTLFKIWQYVAGDNPSLSRQEFYTAMKLVSAAQQRDGVLDEGTASLIVNGLAGAVVPPRMQGMEVPESLMGKEEKVTHKVKAPSSTSVSSSSQGYPVLKQDTVVGYQTAFDQLDGDRDGLVKGSECFQAFMQSGLSKSALKSIWDVVAGNEGALNRHQFIQCMYLIECAKKNYPIPDVLPAGQFPPTERIDVEGLYGQGEQGVGSILSEIGEMPAKVQYQGASGGHAVQFTSILAPKPSESELHGLSASEKNQLEMERKMAEQKEMDLKKLEEERAAVAARHEFYMQSLGDLRLSQSKVSRGLVEAEQRLEMERKECVEMEEQYDAAYTEFNAQHAKVGPMLKALEELEADKAALAAKKAALQSAIDSLEDYDADWEEKENGECEALRVEIAELVSKHAALEKSTEAMQNRRDTMLSIIEGLKAHIDESTSKVGVLKEEVDKMSEDVSDKGKAIVDLLIQVAPLYNTLYSAARDALIPLPNEALVTVSKASAMTSFKYDPEIFGANTGDWHVFEGEEFSTTSAIPLDDRLETFISPTVRKIESEMKEETVDVEMNDRPENPDNMIAEEDPASAPVDDPPVEVSSKTTIDNPVFEGTEDKGEEEPEVTPQNEEVLQEPEPDIAVDEPVVVQDEV